MKRLYCEAQLDIEQLSFQGAIYHRLIKVLRLKNCDEVCFFNGDGFDYFFLVDFIDRKKVQLNFLKKQKNKTESSLYTILLQGVSKGEKMDFALQKAVELGVNEIIPVQTEFSAVKLDLIRAEKKKQHWQSVIYSACEQSERSIIPKLHEITNFNDALLLVDCDQRIILSPRKASETLMESCQKVAILIGPEGGFSEAEMQLAKINRFIDLNLGKRILRTETATICALTFSQIKWGDMNVF